MLTTQPHNLPIKIRPPKIGEDRFFTNCWIKNVRSNEPFKHMDHKLFSREYFPILKNILHRSTTIVATHENEDDEILSFITFERLRTRQTDPPFIVHFIYTKKPYRKLGVANHLINKAFYNERNAQPLVFFTHFDWFGHKMRKRGWVFNPFLIHNR